MAETHVLSALQAKHRRIKGQITSLESDVADLRTDLASVEHVIRLFQQDWRDENGSIAPRKPCRWDRRGEGIKTALAVLRERGSLSRMGAHKGSYAPKGRVLPHYVHVQHGAGPSHWKGCHSA